MTESKHLDDTILALKEMFKGIMFKNTNRIADQKLEHVYQYYKHPNNSYTNTFQIIHKSLEIDTELTCEILERLYSITFNANDLNYLKNVLEIMEREGLIIIINTRNTYNFDTSIDRDFAYFMIVHKQTRKIIISLHLGGDIRGGYSLPYVFIFKNEESLFYDEFFK